MLISFDVDFAKEYGVEIAVIIKVLTAPNSLNEWWTIDELLLMMPYFKTKNKLRRVLDNAIQKNLILKKRADGFTMRWLYKANIQEL